MKKVSFKLKIILILSPLILLSGILGSFIIYELNVNKTDAQELILSAKAQMDLSHLIHELQKERGMSSLYLNQGISSDDLKLQHEKVNLALGSFKHTVSEVRFTNQKSLVSLIEEGINQTRKIIFKQPLTNEVFNSLTDTIKKAISLQIDLFENASYLGIESTFTSLTIFEESKENMGKLRGSLNGVFASNQPRGLSDRDTFANYLSGILINLSSPGLKISHEGKEKVEKILASEKWKEILSAYQVFSQKFSEGNYGINPKEFSANITMQIDAVYEIVKEEQLLNLKHIEIEAARASQNFNLLTGILSSFILGIIYLAYIISKQLILQFTEIGDSLKQASTQLNSASSQIASSSEELSQAATEQAASLEETAASIEEMSSMVQKNAESAQRTSHLALDSNKSAEKGKIVVGNMINAINDISQSNNTIMNQIDQSNQQISDIVKVIAEIGNKTKVINDIVFQTKLLSFYASVEAARAGEHGKGFAVVAEEVGNLAHMSGKAAEEISSMLETSIKKVESIVNVTKQKVGLLVQEGRGKVDTGAHIAKECGDVLNEIVRNISSVTQMANDISIACQEQSQGVQEITKAISQLDQVTQSNAATSEESASSAEELASQSDSLEGIIHNLIEVIKGQQDERQHLLPEKKTARNNVLPIRQKKVKVMSSKQVFKKAAGFDSIPREEDPRFLDI